MTTEAKFITIQVDETEDSPPGFSVPLPGESIIEWRGADGTLLARAVPDEDGTVRMVYGQ